MINMTISLIRTIIFYIVLIIFLRIMGKRQMGELQPGEFAVALLIADLAAIPMQATDIPILNGIIPIATLLALEMSVSFLTLKFRKLRTIISGHPAIVVENGEINKSMMKKLRINTDDLFKELRLCGHSDIREIKYAIVETNGQLSVFPKEDKGIYFAAVSDGKEDADVTNRLNLTSQRLKAILKKNGFSDTKEVFVLCMNTEGDYFIQ